MIKMTIYYIEINYKGDTALHKAMRNESFYAVTQLITQGASVDIPNRKGKSFNLLQDLIYRSTKTME